MNQRQGQARQHHQPGPDKNLPLNREGLAAPDYANLRVDARLCSSVDNGQPTEPDLPKLARGFPGALPAVANQGDFLLL
jgi:hypothetical protein